MHPPLSPSDLATLIDEADAAARRLRRKPALSAADLDDLRQDLLVDLICRLPGFDKRRGSIGAFANVVLRNQCSRIAIRHHRQRQAQGGTVLSLDTPVAGSGEPLGCLLAETDGLAAWHGQDRCAATEVETRHDLARALADLPEEARGLCAALGACAVAELVGRDGRSRSALYRRLARLRLDLAMRGLGGRWDGLRAA
ncbi:sigma factor [Tabrizicola sp. YIM 78059]|uniref:sigma factor n=1 Tax=Tabrizicola sp. YIM 78059 TaxID=2529861 RepID=UPI00145AD4B1|nr:sigma factor [Tabrizicola sp. YIM 78059]